MDFKNIFILLLIILGFESKSQENQHAKINSNISWQEADSLRQVYMEKQSFDTALVYAEKALELAEHKYGKMDTVYADMLEGIGYVYGYSGNFKKALEYNIREKVIRKEKQGIDHPKYGKCLNNIAFLSERMGEYDKALPLYLEALENCEKSMGKDHSEYGVRLNNLANLYQSIGQYNEALPLYLEALENCEKTLGKNHASYGVRLNNLALLYEHMGLYDKALPLYLEAIENSEKSVGKDHSSYGVRLNNLANFYHSIGQYDKALPLYLEALENCEKSLGRDHSEYGVRLNNLAGLYNSMGQYEKALPLYMEAMENQEKTLGKDHSLYGVSLNNIAVLYEHMGKHEKALPLYLEALENTEKSLGRDHYLYGVRLNNLANLYKIMGQYSEALSLYTEALETYEKSLGKNHSLYAISLNNLAEMYEVTGQFDMALPFILEAIQNNFYNINQVFSFLAEREKENYIKTLSEDFTAYKNFFFDYNLVYPELAGDAYNIELTTKGMILQSGMQMRESIQQSEDSAIVAKYDQWRLLRMKLAKQYGLPKEKRSKDISAMEAEAESLESELTRISLTFSKANALTQMRWEDVQEKLKTGQSAIEFSSFAYKKDGKLTDSVMYVAILLRSDEKPRLIPLFEENQLEEIIGTFPGNSYMYINSIYGSATEPNTALNKMIWKPIEKHLKEDYTVYICPVGLLHKISFAAIINNEGLYLSDKYDINLVSSTSLIPEKSDETGFEIENVSLFGGIDYDGENTTKKVWQYLSGTLTEVEEISKILGRVSHEVYSGKEATESNFRKASENSDVLHIATHGFFYPAPELQSDIEKGSGYGVVSFIENPRPLMRSGLAFAGANEVWNIEKAPEGDEGVLTAQEVGEINFMNTRLVVLSACETGLGDIKGSEGVYGLQRSFKMAGVDKIIMSLWQVPDKETEAFMTTFYENLLKEKNIRTAFNQTQKEMREKYDPFFWGAFVLIE